ncbi:glycosyltransferase [Flavobacteriaceae bacterium]|nr:glycosyltransferase [Flavobacteriaceae bacterium]
MDIDPWGGSEALWFKCALQAIKEKHEITVCVKYWGEKEHPNVEQLRAKGAKIIYRNEPSKHKSKPSVHDIIRFRLRKHLGVIIKAKDNQQKRISLEDKVGLNYDVICASQGAAYDITVKKEIYSFFENLTVPYITITQFNYDYGYTLKQEFFFKARSIFQKAKLNLFVSRSNLESVEHQICMSLNNGLVINNPLNLANTEYIPYPDLDKETITFACVSRLYCKTKALDILIRTLSDTNWKNRNWVLNIYGKGEDEFYLKQLIKFHNLEDKIFIKGHISNIDAVWESSHILILPSIYEGTPISLHEAMLKGRACITTHVAGIPEYIVDEYNGFLSPSPNYFYLSKTLEKAWSKKRDWSTMGLSARGSLLKQIDLTPEKTLLEYLLITSSQS